MGITREDPKKSSTSISPDPRLSSSTTTSSHLARSRSLSTNARNVKSPPTWLTTQIVILAESAASCTTASPPMGRDFQFPRTTQELRRPLLLLQPPRQQPRRRRARNDERLNS